MLLLNDPSKSQGNDQEEHNLTNYGEDYLIMPEPQPQPAVKPPMSEKKSRSSARIEVDIEQQSLLSDRSIHLFAGVKEAPVPNIQNMRKKDGLT